ncbi:hypothetical protein CKO25_08875 [Thiocapsa imhoffii]|uniref:Xcc1710-like domain-containing protein n=1 Tax=Thiocapsa imhoffii TaxID=382777 RepID=A0A9X0WHF3_9GAMM|nr:Mth938-like domain-containing protein [Thiocapsa imhoffii]MBK1644759.1 hypothetical protein [Thiocapsa imhoffii]
MKFSEIHDSAGYLVESYGPDGICIAGRWITSGMMLAPGRVQADWGPMVPGDLRVEHLEELLAFDGPAPPQVLVIGTGATQTFPAPELSMVVLSRGIGLEVMSTGAACRTYNILVGEGRRVVAGLMPWGA